MSQQPVAPIIQQHLPEILNLMTLLDQELINDPDTVYHKNAPILYDTFNFLMFILPKKDVTTENYKDYIKPFLKGTEIGKRLGKEEYIPLSQKPIPPEESFEKYIKNYIENIKCEVYPEHMYNFQIVIISELQSNHNSNTTDIEFDTTDIEFDIKKAYSKITGKSWETDFDIEEMNKEIAKTRKFDYIQTTFYSEEDNDDNTLIKSIIPKKPIINKSAYNLHLLQYRYDIEAKPNASISEIINTYKSLKAPSNQPPPSN